MTPFDRHELSALMASHDGPCVTITMPLHGRPPGSQQDPILYANLVRQVRDILEARPGGKRDGVLSSILSRLESVGTGVEAQGGANGYSFWNRQGRGLAVFASPDHFAWYQVAIPLREIHVVADSFHVKPLLPLLYDDLRYHVLSVSRDEVKIYEGSAAHIEELDVEGIPKNMWEAVGSEFDDSKQGQSFHGTPSHGKGRGGGAGGTHFHGYGGSDKHAATDMINFLRELDRCVLERVSQPTRRPLILCALDTHHPVFRQVSHNPFLVPEGIRHSPKGLSAEQIREQAWAIFEPLRDARIDQALDACGAATARGLGANDLAEVANAAVQARVGRLLIEDQRRVWGSLDRTTGAVAYDAEPGGDNAADILDDLAEVVLAFGGEVLLVPKDRMPTSSGVAATFRF